MAAGKGLHLNVRQNAGSFLLWRVQQCSYTSSTDTLHLEKNIQPVTYFIFCMVE